MASAMVRPTELIRWSDNLGKEGRRKATRPTEYCVIRANSRAGLLTNREVLSSERYYGTFCHWPIERQETRHKDLRAGRPVRKTERQIGDSRSIQLHIAKSVLGFDCDHCTTDASGGDLMQLNAFSIVRAPCSSHQSTF